ncbi:pyridoxamine 5'-phosphate oxidase family protein [Desertivirga xinjiangensis]|uniref:pyridoxamine 5'-phosphate oxidase family protein n=1 Tax=Desertivirga xinjiangensis TaxID=539206 RepID=UPI00210AF0AB|nr:pyridoxamine 5'-phosphate oxidase family protein [Pedobacter xinjiangensis]
MQSTRDNIEKMKELIQGIEIAMLSTLHEDEIKTRPMATTEVDQEGNIWFFTDEYSEKVSDLQERHKVCLSYSHPGKDSYVTVNGYAEVVNDKDKMIALFSPVVKRFFPGGIDDPRLSLLKIIPYQMEYWESHSEDGMLHFMGVLGSSPIADEDLHHDEHGKISF